MKTKPILIALFHFFLFALSCNIVKAEPTLSIASGLMQQLEPVVIKGNNFGSTGPKILKWDQFEGENNSIINGYELDCQDAGPTYSTSQSYGAGNTSSKAPFIKTTRYRCAASLLFPEQQELYISYMSYTPSNNDGNIKYGRAVNDGQNNDPGIGYTGGINYWYVWTGGQNDVAYYAKGPFTNKNKWVRVEMYNKLSTPGVANGAYMFAYNLNVERSDGQNFAYKTRDSGLNKGFRYFHLPFYV